MSEINQELVRALKQLSEQYEQQFAEVTEQLNELGEQIILLTTEPKEPKNNITLSLEGATASELKELIKSKNGDSQCRNCKHAKYTLQKVAIGDAPKNFFRFICLLDHDSRETIACCQFQPR